MEDKTKRNTSSIVLDEKQERWFVNHFKHTKNEEIAKKLGISMRSVNRLASRMGLHKTKQFVSKCQKEASEAAHQSHLRNGTYPPKGFIVPGSEKTRFKKGETSIQRLGVKKERIRLEKSLETRKKTYKSEKARVTFGLPQKTKMRVLRQPNAKIQLRYQLKKKGYIVDDVQRIAFYNENTKRGKRIESKPQLWYKFQPLN